MFSDTRRRVAGFIWACVFATAASQASALASTPPDGVVSTSLCADAYVIDLVPRDQITALSWQSRQGVSAAPDWARALPQASARAEPLLQLRPRLTVFGAGEGQRARDILTRTGHATIALGWGESFQTVRDNYRRLGDALADPAAANARIAALDRRLEVLRERSARRGVRPRIAYLSSSGGSAGAETYIDAAIRAAGGVNLVAEAGASGWTRSDPEFALILTPDILLTSFFEDGFAGRLSRARYHSAYSRLLAAPGRVDIPAGLWPCAGPGLIEAAERIADAIDEWSLSQ